MMFALIGLTAVSMAVSLANWRHGVFCVTVLDVLRDPCRKMTAGEPAWMTQVLVPVWAVIFISCLSQKGSVVRDLRRIFPKIRSGVLMLVTALIPGLFMSLLLYRNGWLVAGIGGLSYVGPMAGLLIGCCLAMDYQTVIRFLKFYVFVNSAALVGSLAEHLSWDWPALGGMAGMQWIRHIPGIQVKMISGFFRSPDIAGFHAANVLVFTLMLALPRGPKKKVELGWLGFGVWAAYVISLAGRRKMLAIPVVFVLTYVGLVILLRRREAGLSIRYMLLAVILLVAGVTYSLGRQDDVDDRSTYFSTAIVDAVPKVYDSIFGASVTTLRQSGILGSGLGVASQGAQHAGIDRSRVWQEDGTSRLFKELGVIGVLFLVGAMWNFFQDFRKAIRTKLNDPTRSMLQLTGMGFAAGILASFVISHQHISGDAANGVVCLLFLGGTLGHVIAEKRQLLSSRTVHSIGSPPGRSAPGSLTTPGGR